MRRWVKGFKSQEHYRKLLKNFMMLSSPYLYIAYCFCSALHSIRAWKAVFRRYCGEGLKWCRSLLAENNERLPLTSVSFRSGSQGGKLGHEASLIHPDTPTQTAPADSTGSGEQNLHFWTSFGADLLCCLQVHREKQCARGQENLAQLPRWDAETGSRGVLSREVVSSSDRVWNSAGALQRGRVLPGSGRVASCRFERQLLPATAEVLCSPWFGKGESMSMAVLCCACFYCSLLCSSEVELDQ